MTVQELFSSEQNWTKGIAAKNAFGVTVPVRSRTAAKWCLLGAIAKCYGGERANEIEIKVIDKLFGGRKRRLGDCLSVWNDSPQRTFRDVKNLATELNI